MKKYIVAVFLLLMCAFCSGCITAEETTDPIVGTWVSGEYTNLAGTHYIKMIEQFSSDYKILEHLFGDDGTVVTTSSVWIKRGDKEYISYYAPITFTFNPLKNTAIMNCDFFNLKNVQMSRNDVDSGFVGVWMNDEPSEMLDDIYYLQFDINEGGTGNVTYIQQDMVKSGSSIIYWSELGDNMYVITITDPVEWTIGSDGNLHDNYGCVYVKQTDTE